MGNTDQTSGVGSERLQHTSEPVPEGRFYQPLGPSRSSEVILSEVSESLWIVRKDRFVQIRSLLGVNFRRLFVQQVLPTPGSMPIVQWSAVYPGTFYPVIRLSVLLKNYDIAC